MNNRDFWIDDKYLTSVPVTYKWGIDKDNGITGSIDHPSFAALRTTLENQDFIKTARNMSNGDTVLKDFNLNGSTFRVGDRFPCADAIGWRIKHGA